MTEEYAVSRYEEACALLPGRLRAAAMSISQREKARTEELRLRIGRALYLTTPAGETALPQTRVIRSDLEQVLDRATEYSRYTAAGTMAHGYLTAPGGFRIGVCGTALPTGPGAGTNEGVRDVSSLAIRIPRVREGTARSVLELQCDRCGKTFSREHVVVLDNLVAQELEDEENDDILLLDGVELDLDEAVTTAFILAMDTKNLCSDDCKGLCAKCGADLNLGPCGCGPDVDSRLAALAQLLDKEAE